MALGFIAMDQDLLCRHRRAARDPAARAKAHGQRGHLAPRNLGKGPHRREDRGDTARPHPIITWIAARMRPSSATTKPLRATLMEKAGALALPPARCLAPQPPHRQGRGSPCTPAISKSALHLLHARDKRLQDPIMKGHAYDECTDLPPRPRRPNSRHRLTDAAFASFPD